MKGNRERERERQTMVIIFSPVEIRLEYVLLTPDEIGDTIVDPIIVEDSTN